jgi:hypothetical protein
VSSRQRLVLDGTIARDLLIAIFSLFGFVTFTAASAAALRGSNGLPWWSRACVNQPSPRGRYGRLAVSIWYGLFAAFTILFVLIALGTGIARSELLVAVTSAAVAIGMAAWVRFLWRWWKPLTT